MTSTVIKDYGGQAAAVDATGGLVTIDEIHRKIHQGILFSSSHYASAVANDATVLLLITTAADTYAHMRFGIAVSGNCEIELLENPTTTDPGTGLSEVNRDRTSATTADVTVAHTPTVSVDGTTVFHGFIPGGHARAVPIGGQHRSFEEWVLIADEEYVLRVTNRSGGAAVIAVSLDWYEV